MSEIPSDQDGGLEIFKGWNKLKDNAEIANNPQILEVNTVKV